MELVGGPFVLLADLVELPHVLEEVGASLEGDEKLGLLAVAPVVRSLNCDGLGSDFLECGVVVPIQKNEQGEPNMHFRRPATCDHHLSNIFQSAR